MAKPNIFEINTQTGKQIVREMNEDEYAQHLLHQEKSALEQAARESEAFAAE
jgi:hypothetical protein